MITKTRPPSCKTPIALTIAGSDSSGGAGIQADIKAFSALQVYGASVITALTAQNTRAVTAVHEVPPDIVCAQIRAVFDDLDVGAVKIGMLCSVAIIEAVADELAGHDVPIVIDPVMVAKSGDALLHDDAVACVRERLLPLATVLTPNLPEAARLLDLDPAHAMSDVVSQGTALLALGAQAVLMKGGHAQGTQCIDVLLCAQQPQAEFCAPRVVTKNTHGTGCTLSASIAAGLAKGLQLHRAVDAAHQYLQAAIRAADSLTIGSGHGPVHHFHALWKQAK